MSETSERPHRTGFFWLDLLVAISAVIISVVSLFVAQRADRTQERLLAASTWPYVEFSTSNFLENRRLVALTLRNSGVGPARIRWMTVDYRAKAIANNHALLLECCDAAPPHALSKTLLSSTVTHTVLVPHESVNFLEVTPNAQDRVAFESINKERNNIHVRVCYCSVLDECWLLDNASYDDPHVVPNCNPPGGTLFNG